MENEDPIENESPFNEGSLIQVGNPICYKGRPTSVPFSKDKKDNSNDCYRTEMTNIGRSEDFGGERYYPILKAGNVHHSLEEFPKKIQDIVP